MDEQTWTARHNVGCISCPVSPANVAMHSNRTVGSLAGIDEVVHGDWTMTRNGSLKGLVAAREHGRARVDMGRKPENDNGRVPA